MTQCDNRRSDVIDEAVDALRNTRVPDGPPLQLQVSTIEVLQSSTKTLLANRLQPRRKRMIRIARYGGLSAAALVLVATVSWLPFMNGTDNIAFGDVIHNIKQAKSVTLVCRQKIGKQPEFEFQWSLQGNAVRMEIPGALILITDLKQKKVLQIDQSRKVAYQFPVHKDVAAAFSNPIQQLRRIRPEDAKRLGEEAVNGRKAIVYQVEQIDLFGMKGKGDMKIWVDPKTKLPVKIRIGVNSRRGSKPEDRPFDTQMTFEQFEWNKRLDPKLFSLEVPKGFEVKKGRPGPTE